MPPTPSSAGRVAARKPPYEVIAAHFRERIERGTLKAGDPLPSFPEIAQTWRVARQTVDRAIEQLRSEGLLAVGGADGVVVASPPQRRGSLGVVLDGLTGARVDAVELTELAPDVADQLGVQPGSSLLILHFTVAR